jgi:16S rRNA G966 N2-methylase RsmD
MEMAALARSVFCDAGEVADSCLSTFADALLLNGISQMGARRTTMAVRPATTARRLFGDFRWLSSDIRDLWDRYRGTKQYFTLVFLDPPASRLS